MSGGVTSWLFGTSAPPSAPQASDASTSFPLWLQQAVYGAVSGAGALASQPYTAYTGQQVATPSNETQASWNLAQSNVGNWQPSVNTATSLTQAAATPITGSNINPYASNYTSQVGGMGGALTAGINQATQSQIANYQDPNLSSEISGVESALNTNLANTMQGTESQFVSAGQAGSPQENQAQAENVYYNQQALGQEVGSLEQSSYGQALSAAQNATSAGYGLGSSGYSGALSTALGEQQMQQTTGAQMGQLGALTSQLGATDVSQLATAGSAQDTVSQENLNAAMNNFEQQQEYPYAQLAYASDIIRGLPTTSSTSTNAATTYSYPATTSPLQTGLSTALLTGALGVAKGGHIRKATPPHGGALLVIVPMPRGPRRYQGGGVAGGASMTPNDPSLGVNPLLMSLVNGPTGSDPSTLLALREFLAGQGEAPSGYRRGGALRAA